MQKKVNCFYLSLPLADLDSVPLKYKRAFYAAWLLFWLLWGLGLEV